MCCSDSLSSVLTYLIAMSAMGLSIFESP
uniref:Uncharacterized protein n=1 Tax=Anguilla anguilla TaxID=7936 RepID=A0A0E9Y0H3_ANGAN